MTSRPAPLPAGDAAVLLDRLALPMLYLDAGEIAMGEATGDPGVVAAELRLAGQLPDEELLGLAGRLLTHPLVVSLTFSRASPSPPWSPARPRALAVARIESEGGSWTLELGIRAGGGLQGG